MRQSALDHHDLLGFRPPALQRRTTSCAGYTVAATARQTPDSRRRTAPDRESDQS